jgi:predicted dienelactone hydrolase
MLHVLLFSSLLLGGVPDPGEKGPFAVGFTSLMIADPARLGDGGQYTFRPIPVFVWYPVDPDAIGDSTPLAVYPLDPLYQGAPAGGLPELTSIELEKYGIDRAYEAPPVAARRPFPLLVFSPGFGVPPWVHASIGTRLASHGFVVAVPYHFGDAWWPWEPSHPIDVVCFNRPRDVSFALTELLTKNRTAGDLLQGAVSPSQVAAGGWSLGGYAATTLAAGDDDVCDTPFGNLADPAPCVLPLPRRAEPDPRFKVIVPLDGSSWILHFEELARVGVPSMGMGEEWSTLAVDPIFASWQARQHAAFSGHPNYRADVFGTNHQSFSDLCADIPMLGDLNIWDPATVDFFTSILCTNITPPADTRRLVGKYLIAFLKTNLAGESGYQSILTPGYALTSEPLIEFFATEKRSPSSIQQDWPSDFVYFTHQPGSQQARAEKNPKAVKNAFQRALQPR